MFDKLLIFTFSFKSSKFSLIGSQLIIFPFLQNCEAYTVNNPICAPISITVSSDSIKNPISSYSLFSQTFAKACRSVDLILILHFKLFF